MDIFETVNVLNQNAEKYNLPASFKVHESPISYVFHDDIIGGEIEFTHTIDLKDCQSNDVMESIEKLLKKTETSILGNIGGETYQTGFNNPHTWKTDIKLLIPVLCETTPSGIPCAWKPLDDKTWEVMYGLDKPEGKNPTQTYTKVFTRKFTPPNGESEHNGHML